ncbi:ABC transporter ATP-binding protein [Aquirhabdus parva]|uniref:ABC transporter ATP-binding protein n=1 Tax=Aquirhabdus parva TaxID=2283318 RepID=A0A345PB25_9GAMM|nr:ABC transporter ATP-binding protein [Aquirhabdus parva]AXI04484.1 ABC transporter ATP-binding protein [Aquirhabdus parva]
MLSSDTTSSPLQAEPVLALRSINKFFGSFQALNDLSLEIHAGEIHCLLGENGAGKSTLCNVIFGVISADGGDMTLNGAPYLPSNPKDALNRGVAMVHQHFSLVENTTVLDNLLLGQVRGWLDRKKHAQRIADLLVDLGFELDLFAQVAELSVGQRQRVEIVKCLIRNPQLLILDEPTAVLLPAEIEALLEICKRVAERGCAVILVTHKLAEIRAIAARATVLRGGRIVARSENPAQDLKQLVRAMIQSDDDSALQTPTALLPHAMPLPVATPNSRPLSDEILQVNGLSYQDAQGITRLDNCTFIVNTGEIVAIAGVEGNGQSELAAILAGMLPTSSGRFYVNGRDMTTAQPKEITKAGIGIVPEDRHATGCITAMSVTENILLNHLDQYSRYGFLQRNKMRQDALKLMKQFDVRASSPDLAFGRLSGGNQQKAVLARELTLDSLVFLLAANPTRGLDVGAVGAVYSHLKTARNQGVGVLLISSELEEILSHADRIIVFYRGRIMGSCATQQADRQQIGAWMAGQTL